MRKPSSSRTVFGKKFDDALEFCKTLVTFQYRTVEKIVHDGAICDGITYQIGKDIFIEISRDTLEPRLTLIHEVSHIIAAKRRGNWGGESHTGQHDRIWGESYAELYCKFHDWKYGIKLTENK